MKKPKAKKPAKLVVPIAAADWAVYHPENRKLSALRKNPRNAKTHPQHQIEALTESMRLFGWTMPALVDETDLLLAGHARVEAAGKLGLAEVPVIVARGWTEEMKAAYVEADNRLSEIGTWDEAIRRREVEWLRDKGFDMKPVGWDDAAIAALFAGPGASDPNREWTGMPEFSQQDKTAFRSIVVHFKDQEAVDAFTKLTKFAISEKTKFAWYPEIEIERYADKKYSAE